MKYCNSWKSFFTLWELKHYFHEQQKANYCTPNDIILIKSDMIRCNYNRSSSKEQPSKWSRWQEQARGQEVTTATTSSWWCPVVGPAPPPVYRDFHSPGQRCSRRSPSMSTPSSTTGYWREGKPEPNWKLKEESPKKERNTSMNLDIFMHLKEWEGKEVSSVEDLCCIILFQQDILKVNSILDKKRAMEIWKWVTFNLELIWEIRWTRNQILILMGSYNLLILQSLLIYSCKSVISFIHNCFLYTLPFIVSLGKIDSRKAWTKTILMNFFSDSCCCFTFLRCYFVYFLPYIVNRNCFKNKRKKRQAQFYFW